MTGRMAVLQLLSLIAAACLTACCHADVSNTPKSIISTGSSQLRAQETWKISLPLGSQPEGIAAGSDKDLWVACLSGNIIHVVSRPFLSLRHSDCQCMDHQQQQQQSAGTHRENCPST
jgi:hypothetical protein